LADSDDAPTVTLAEDNGFRLVDIRVTLDRPLTGSEPGPSGNIRLHRPEDIAVLKGLARSSYHLSRFYYDSRFSRSEADALYETWIERSCNGYDDAVLVAEADARPVGFMSVRLAKSTDGEIAGHVGLIGVSGDYQGQGLGGKLVDASLGW